MKPAYAACWLIFLLACRQKTETTKPLIQNITESVYASGKVKSMDQYEVYSTVSGIVDKVYVTDGSVVRKGDVLMTLVNEMQSLQTENARLNLSYQSLHANTDKINEAIANIKLAMIKQQNDSVLLQRQRKLWANEVGSRHELEQKELALKNSSNAYHSAVLHYRQLRQQLEFADKQSRKALQISSALDNDYSIRARQDGKVYVVNREAGEMVTPQAPVAIIGNATEFILELQVDEYDISKIHPGQKLMVTMDSYKSDVFEAIVSKVDPVMNERSRSVKIEARFTRQPLSLLPNLSAEANIVLNTKKNVLTVPRSYLVDETFLLLQNGEKRKVAVGLKDYQLAEIISGISADDVLQKPQQ